MKLTGEVFVVTRRDGLLSRLGHDLKLRIPGVRLEGDVDASTGNYVEIRAEADLRVIDVVCALDGEKEDFTALSARDRASILENVHDDILRTKREPTARFRSTSLELVAADDTMRIAGVLTLAGVSRDVELVATVGARVATCEFDVDQRDYGIRPFSAPLGAIRVKPIVNVSASITR